MRQRPQRSAYDVAIVGGGHNGLAAAAYLARAGRSCVVLERSPSMGGAAVSTLAFAGVDARLSRYSYLVSLLPRKVVRELGLGVRFERREPSSYTPDPRAGGAVGLLIDGRDRDATLASFRAVTGRDGADGAWREFYAMTRRVAQAVFPTLTEPLLARTQMRRLVGEEAWQALFERPLAEALRTRFSDELVAGVVLTDALIGTFASAADPSLRQNRCLLYHVIGGGSGEWRVPVGGMGALSAELERVARRAGAELVGGAEVLAIAPDAGGADVSFGDGDGGGEREGAVRAGHVLVNAAPAELERLLSADRTASSAAHAAPEGAQLKVNMLLDRLPRLRDPRIDPRSAFAGTFHVNEMAGQLQLAYEQAAGGALPDVLPCESYCHSLADPSILGAELRASGAHTLTVFALHTPARLFTAEPAAMRTAALEAVVRSLDSVLAEPIAGCVALDGEGRPCVEVLTPLDVERELRMPGGHIFHRDLSWPFAEDDDELGAWGVETEHPRVMICGAGARRGGGVSCIPGRNAAMAVLCA